MQQSDLLSIFGKHELQSKFLNLWCNSSEQVKISGLHGSATSVWLSLLFKEKAQPVVCILEDKESAAYFHNDLSAFIKEDLLSFFPTSYQRSIRHEKTDPANIILRTDSLNQARLNPNRIIITYPEALVEKVISEGELGNQLLDISVGDNLSIDFLNEVLHEYKFERVDFVYEPGQYSIRGGIIDIFSYSSEYPYRIDFFGDDVETIRAFDTENQLSISNKEQITIVPDLKEMSNQRVSLLEFLPANTIIWSHNLKLSIDRCDILYNDTLLHFKDRNNDEHITQVVCSAQELTNQLAIKNSFETGLKPMFDAKETLQFDQSPQPLFHKNFDLISLNFLELEEKGYSNHVLSGNEKQIDRLQRIFEEKGDHITFNPIMTVLHEGFVDHNLNCSFYTDHQLFDRYHRFHLKTDNFRNSKGKISLKELNQLTIGDYIVHSEHGIGRFAGLVKMDINGKPQEVIKLIYKNDDVLFSSIHSLHRISRYKGKEGQMAKVNKLGSGAWQKLKERAKKKVKDIAEDLIKLYAQRVKESGYAFAPDSFLQTELEASFIYEDTPDQQKATIAVKEDMEKEIPMDRLICGDVGFGKTEVAIRAAFKAVTEGKQVAILVPTTILAFQHYNTFKERLKDFPVKVDYLSRMRKASEVKETLKDIKSGVANIVIGTHRLTGKDIVFNDLGLLIIDEEQRFGVAIKEKLKTIRVNVDTLTLTATPIPRTLQFSLMGARDLSVINTPPPNRYPIQTETHPFNEEVIRESIRYELDRNGQVFFIHNRIQNIHEVEAMIRRTVPEARTVVGHGQMDGSKLETVLLDFMAGEYDVLIATTIIESGLDIPNANTIIINNAQNFGLSELHQLRGRVGRSNKKAFCYLLAPPIATLPDDSRRRLMAIETFSDLGSGIQIAMQDLDIRGSGNLLGGEQSGFIADIGIETYHRILQEALQELQEGDYKELFMQRKSDQLLTQRFITDCTVESDLEMLIPDEYVSNISERMNLYRELDNITNKTDLEAFEKDITDRFGAIPKVTKELITLVQMRWCAQELGIEKVILKNGKMLTHFVSDISSPFYQSDNFMKIINFIQHNPNYCRMKESKEKLTLIFDKVPSIAKAFHLLSQIKS